MESESESESKSTHKRVDMRRKLGVDLVNVWRDRISGMRHLELYRREGCLALFVT